ncbi:hypothetical protein D3C72_2585820 [compost metagenome]
MGDGPGSPSNISRAKLIIRPPGRTHSGGSPVQASSAASGKNPANSSSVAQSPSSPTLEMNSPRTCKS